MADSPDIKQHPEGSRQAKVVQSRSYPYLLYLPAEYDAREKWPFILFLHGAGERGDDLDRLKTLGIPKIVEREDNFPFIGVSPQCPRGAFWDTRRLVLLLEETMARYKTDHGRIYLTGVSMGGYGTWRVAAEIPHRLAAIAPVCGGGDPKSTCRLRAVPAWAFHGARDDIVPLSESRKMVDALRECGGSARFTVYPDAGHDSWTATYDNPELFEWFLAHQREAWG